MLQVLLPVGIALLAAFLVAAGAAAAEPAWLQAEEIARFAAEEAHQGVAVDATHFYAVDNAAIGKYDKATGRRMARWQGAAGGPFVHLNSCKAISGGLLRCAHSNSPHQPTASSVEIFETEPLHPLRSIALGLLPGALTWIAEDAEGLWLLLARYDSRTPEHGTPYTRLVHADNKWRTNRGWALPRSVLDRMTPGSASGGAWGPDGLLYVTGHDRCEMYVLARPAGDPVLVHVATIDVPVAGQAFAFDPARLDERIVYGVSRPRREVVVFRLPPVPASAIIPEPSVGRSTSSPRRRSTSESVPSTCVRMANRGN